MEILYLVLIVVGILILLPIIGFILILLLGLINRFRDNSSTLGKRSERYGVDSMGVLQGGESFDDY